MRQNTGITEREEAVLRLLVQGHEAKSIAATLGLSVHAVNERLRDARRKLGASSSREAARRFFGEGTAGGATPQISRDKYPGLGGADGRALMESGASPGSGSRRLPVIALGVTFMLSLIAIGVALGSADKAALPPEPTVAHTSPEAGAAIPAGPFTLSVTFDRPMRADSYSFVQVSADSFPQCEKAPPQVSADRRRFSLRCTAQAGKRYEVWFNRPPYTAFQSETGATAPAYRLTFQTRK